MSSVGVTTPTPGAHASRRTVPKKQILLLGLLLVVATLALYYPTGRSLFLNYDDIWLTLLRLDRNRCARGSFSSNSQEKLLADGAASGSLVEANTFTIPIFDTKY